MFGSYYSDAMVSLVSPAASEGSWCTNIQQALAATALVLVVAVLSQTAAMKQRACFVPARNSSSQDQLFVLLTTSLKNLSSICQHSSYFE